MTTIKKLLLIFAILVTAGFLGYSTWHQWRDNQTTTLERMRPIAPVATFSHGGSIRQIAYDPKNSELIATAGAGDFVKVWNRNKHDYPQLSLEFQKDSDGSTNILGLAFSPTDNLIATKTYWTLEIWDSRSGNRINKLDIPCSAFILHPQGKYIVMNTPGFTQWNFKDPKNIKAEIMLPSKMDWDSINLDGLERTHEYEDKNIIRHEIPVKYFNAATNQHFMSVDISPDGKLIAASGEKHDRTTEEWKSVLTIWNYQKEKMSKILVREDAKIPDLKPNDKRTPSLSFPTSNRIRSIEFSPDNHFFGLAAENGFTIWSLPEWKIYHEVMDKLINDITFSPDGNLFAVADVKGITLWDIETLTPIALLKDKGILAFVSLIEFSPDGNTLAGGGFDGVLRLWDVSELNED